MAYVDGFVIAVPTARKQQFIDHAGKAGSVFKERRRPPSCAVWHPYAPPTMPCRKPLSPTLP